MSSAAQTHVFPTPKFQNLLFTTDLSACSDMALPVALGLARQYGSTVHVLHVIPPEPMIVAEYGGPVVEIETGFEAAARAKVEHLCESSHFGEVLYTQTVQRGVIWDTAQELIKKMNIDLVVMGTHGRRGVRHLVLGSVAEQVFRRAMCPVLTVGPEAKTDGLATGKVMHIVYATDFSQASLLALPYAVTLARGYKAHLTLLHAIDRGESEFDHFEAIFNSKTRISKLMPADSDVHRSIATDYKPPVEMILEMSRNARRPADLIVMGAHHGAGSSAHAPWSIAHQVMCLAPCPVLTVSC